MKLAAQLDPLAPQIVTDLDYALYLARQYDDALLQAQRVWRMDSTKSDNVLQLGEIQLARGQPDSALAWFALAQRLGTGFDMRAFMSIAYRRLGRTRLADSLYHALYQQYRSDPTLDYAVAIAAGGAGDMDRAMQATQQIVSRRDVLATEISLACDAMYDPLKRDPRYSRMLSRAGMKVCPAR